MAGGESVCIGKAVAEAVSTWAAVAEVTISGIGVASGEETGLQAEINTTRTQNKRFLFITHLCISAIISGTRACVLLETFRLAD